MFGKIVEITDEAIFIDIPGKARAIFDRAEMMLPDDDDTATSSGVRAVLSHASPASTPRRPIEGAARIDGRGHERLGGPRDTCRARRNSPGGRRRERPAGRASGRGAGPAVPAEVAAAPPVPEPPKEPKVPHVILEVGADFIGVVHNDGMRGGLSC